MNIYCEYLKPYHIQVLTLRTTPPQASLQEEHGPGRPESSAGQSPDPSSGPQPDKSQTGDGNHRRFSTRARKPSKRKQGIMSDEKLQKESKILKNAARERREEAHTLLPLLPDI